MGHPRGPQAAVLAGHPARPSLARRSGSPSRSPTPTGSATSSPPTRPATRSPPTSVPRSDGSRCCRSSSAVRPLGLLAHSDTEERFTRTKSELEGTLKITLGGLAAEQLFFGESGTGPSSDLQTATELAAQMIGSFGMGNSLVAYEAFSTAPTRRPTSSPRCSLTRTPRKRSTRSCSRHKDQVLFLLEKNRDLVEALRDALLEQEELLGDEIRAVIEETLQRRSVVAG